MTPSFRPTEPVWDFEGPCEAVLVEGLARLSLPEGFRLERLLANRYRVLGPEGAEGRLWFESMEVVGETGGPPKPDERGAVIRDVPPALLIAFQQRRATEEEFSVSTVMLGSERHRVAIRTQEVPAIGRSRFASLSAPEAAFAALEPVARALDAALLPETMTPLDRVAIAPGWKRVNIRNVASLRVPQAWRRQGGEKTETYFENAPDENVSRRQIELRIDRIGWDVFAQARSLDDVVGPILRGYREAAGLMPLVGPVVTDFNPAGPCIRFETKEVLGGTRVRQQRSEQIVPGPRHISIHRFIYAGREPPEGTPEPAEETEMRARMLEEIDAALLFDDQLPGDPEPELSPVEVSAGWFTTVTGRIDDPGGGASQPPPASLPPADEGRSGVISLGHGLLQLTVPAGVTYRPTAFDGGDLRLPDQTVVDYDLWTFEDAGRVGSGDVADFARLAGVPDADLAGLDLAALCREPLAYGLAEDGRPPRHALLLAETIEDRVLRLARLALQPGGSEEPLWRLARTARFAEGRTVMDDLAPTPELDRIVVGDRVVIRVPRGWPLEEAGDSYVFDVPNLHGRDDPASECSFWVSPSTPDVEALSGAVDRARGRAAEERQQRPQRHDEKGRNRKPRDNDVYGFWDITEEDSRDEGGPVHTWQAMRMIFGPGPKGPAFQWVIYRLSAREQARRHPDMDGVIALVYREMRQSLVLARDSWEILWNR